jgi:hypothetical protein
MRLGKEDMIDEDHDNRTTEEKEAQNALQEIFDAADGKDSGIKEDPCWHFWLAYYSDFSEMVAFPTEIEALRHAVGNHMSVKKVYAGFSLRYDSYQL